MDFNLAKTTPVNAVMICILLGFLISSSPSRAQSPQADQLKKALDNHPTKDSVRLELLNSLIYEVYSIDSQQAQHLIREAEALATQLNAMAAKAEIIYFKGHLEKIQSNHTKALAYYNQSMGIYESINHHRGMSYCLNNIGIVYYNQGDYEQAIEYYEKSMEYDKKLDDLHGVSTCMNNIANIYADQGNYEQAIDYYTQYKTINEKLGDAHGVARACSNIGTIYGEQGNLPKALEYFNQALVIVEKSQSSFTLPSLFSNIGYIYQSNDDLKQALYYYTQGLEASKKQGNQKAITKYLINIGNVYEKQAKNEKALTLFEEALKISEETHNPVGTILALIEIGNIKSTLAKNDQALTFYSRALNLSQELRYRAGMVRPSLGMALVYHRQEQYVKALKHALQGQRIADELKVLKPQRSIAQLLSKIYESMDNHKKAYESHQLFKSLSDSLFNKENIQKITRLEYEYKYQRELDSAKRRELSLTHQIKVVDENLAVSERQKLLAIIGVLILLLIIGIGILLQRIKNIRSINESILMEQKLLRSQMTPHFIFNSLSVLQGMILNQEATKAVTYLSKFSRLMRIVLENSRDKTVTLENELKAIEHYIGIQNLGAETPYSYSADVDDSIDQKNTLVPPMLIQPFVENAIEHAFRETDRDKRISLIIKQTNDQIICSISDNGIGIETERVGHDVSKKSLSTTITAERLKMLSKEFKIKTDLHIKDRKLSGEKGTEIVLTLPYQIQDHD